MTARFAGMTVAGGDPPAPPPPPGPGVQPPFVAPPIDGVRKRMWIGLGAGAAVALLCCGGGIFGIRTLVTSAEAAWPAEATKTVTEFLTDIRDGRFADAFALECEVVRDGRSLATFTRIYSLRSLASFRVHVPQATRTDALSVTADLAYTDGTTATERYIVQLASDGTARVCD